MKPLRELNKIGLAALALVSMTDACAKKPISTDTHCSSSETIYFSCSTAGGKIISICGIPANTVAKNTKNLQYRFGRKGSIELIFPKTMTKDGNSKFFYNHYFRAKTDYYQIGFVNKDHEYRVYRNYEGELSNIIKYGVEVKSTKTFLENTVSCAASIVDHLSGLDGSLRCDKDNALGCGSR